MNRHNPVLTNGCGRIRYNGREPLTTLVRLDFEPPSLSDNRGHQERLLASLEKIAPGPWTFPLPVLRRLPEVMDAGTVQAFVCPDTGQVVDLISGVHHEKAFGLAVDLGTTTVVARLVDLADGREVQHAGALNLQMAWGEDLLTRIAWVREGKLDRLRSLVLETINGLNDQLTSGAGIDPREVRACVVAGNTVMTHLLLGVDPRGIPREPYLPVANSFSCQRAEDVGLNLSPAAPVWFPPNVGSFVGGDVLAGVLAAGMARDEGPSLLLDVGTNGEVVLGGADWLVACAGAAGPAFEGGVAKKGIRAQEGAIDHVAIDPDGRVTCTTIGGGKAKGLCGSGLIDAVAQLFRAGLLDRTGALRRGESFLIIPGGKTVDGQPITLDQTDIANFLRTKAAMFAAVDLTLDRVGLSPTDLKRVYLAGAVANYIDVDEAITIGLLPDLPPNRFVPLGNASLEGAHLCLMHRQARIDLRALAARVSYLELNAEREFMDRFAAALFLPHTDESHFPSLAARLGKRQC